MPSGGNNVRYEAVDPTPFLPGAALLDQSGKMISSMILKEMEAHLRARVFFYSLDMMEKRWSSIREAYNYTLSM